MPSSYNFGSLNVGVQGLAQAIILTNNSGASVTVSNVTVGPSSDFSLSTNLCGTVPNGGSCQILAAFRPSQAGTRSGTVTHHLLGSGSPQTITLSGTGVGTTPPPPPPAAEQGDRGRVLPRRHGPLLLDRLPDEIAVSTAARRLGWVRTGQRVQG